MLILSREGFKILTGNSNLLRAIAPRVLQLVHRNAALLLAGQQYAATPFGHECSNRDRAKDCTTCCCSLATTKHAHTHARAYTYRKDIILPRGFPRPYDTISPQRRRRRRNISVTTAAGCRPPPADRVFSFLC